MPYVPFSEGFSAEDQLRLLRQALSDVNDVVLITEADPIDEPGPRIIFANHAFERVTGYSVQEALGRSPRFLRTPETSRTACDHIRTALLEQRPVNQELLNRRKDGTLYWTEIHITPLFDERGKLTHFIAVERDITERKQTLKALENSNRQLEAAQALAGVGSWEWNVKEDVAYWSDEMYRLCGLEPQSRNFTRRSFLEMVHPEDRAALHAAVDRVLTTHGTIEQVFRIVRHDGSARHFHARATVLCDGHGEADRLIGAAQDITEKIEAEEAKIQAARLEAARREMESFSYSVSHDLRAPVRRIIAYAQILTEPTNQAHLGGEAQHCVASIRECARHMDTLIEDMLSLAQVTRAALRRQTCDLTAIAAGILKQFAEADPSRSVEVSVEPNLAADADYNLTRILLQNLLANAWKFTRRQEHAQIEVGRSTHRGRLMFYVKDNGVGFNPAHAGHLFQPFQRLHSITEFEGTGIGLATVHRIVTRHGGEVDAEGEVKKGATIWFCLEGAPHSR